ncbi:MAG: porin [Candidatus Amulumruptor caecigallinarius]|nr:porin [Candidatus Amulumruptor caecigallinarius]
MKVLRIAGISVLIAGSMVSAMAQEDDKPKFKFTPAARILLDGAVFAPHHDGFADGVAIPDIRIGGKMTYGNWLAKIDVGYGFGKIGMKDVYLQYKFNDNNLIRAGYFVHQFGLQSATSSSMKPSFEAPITDSYMNATGRNLGVMYMYDKNQFLATASVIVGTNITQPANESGKVSLGAISRLLWRPYHSTGTVAQVGVSGWYQSAFHEKITNEEGEPGISSGFFDYSVNYPTRVDKITLLQTNIENARGVFKLSPELLFSKGRFALEGQYYYMNVNRKDGPAFVSNGAYGLLRGLLVGDREYGYSSADGGLATPNPKTLEVVLGYNYTNANSNKAGIYGGITNDWSCTFNYYINKYMLCRLRWSYTNVRNSEVVPKNHVNIFEARVQFKF